MAKLLFYFDGHSHVGFKFQRSDERHHSLLGEDNVSTVQKMSLQFKEQSQKRLGWILGLSQDYEQINGHTHFSREKIIYGLLTLV